MTLFFVLNHSIDVLPCEKSEIPAVGEAGRTIYSPLSGHTNYPHCMSCTLPIKSPLQGACRQQSFSHRPSITRFKLASEQLGKELDNYTAATATHDNGEALYDSQKQVLPNYGSFVPL